MKRRPKPKTLLLSEKSPRSTARLMAVMALVDAEFRNDADVSPEFRYMRRAQTMLRLLRCVT